MEIDKERVIRLLQYRGRCMRVRSAIVETLLRLPEDVREWALERCRFTSTGVETLGRSAPSMQFTYCKGDVFAQTWVVVISEFQSGEDLRGVVAHEIAHGWLYQQNKTDGGRDDVERRATALVREWGFSGAGTHGVQLHPFIFAVSLFNFTSEEVGQLPTVATEQLLGSLWAASEEAARERVESLVSERFDKSQWAKVAIQVQHFLSSD